MLEEHYPGCNLHVPQLPASRHHEAQGCRILVRLKGRGALQ